MTKGRDKPGRDKKKPKQEGSGGKKSAYAQSMVTKGAPAPLGSKK
jgi:hypothetical protein